MSDRVSNRRRHYWERYVREDGAWIKDGPPGADLAKLRRGVGRDAGDVPEMWQFYTTLTSDGHRPLALLAEHAALTLYAVHQQSQSRPMHRAGIGLGSAMGALRISDKFSQEAVDRRFAAAATATSFTEVCLHLRGLITQLRVIGKPLDYTRLCADLRGWQRPGQVAEVRRRWGGQYFTPSTTKSGGADPNGAGAGSPTVPQQPRPSNTITNTAV